MKLILALSALILTAPLHAAGESRSIDLSFYCLKYVPGLETIHVSKDKITQPVRLSTANMTNPITATVVDGEATFLRAPLSPDVKVAIPLAAKVKIPAEIQKALVVLIPNPPESAEPYHALLIDRGDNFKLGTYRVVNFTPRSIRGAIGRSYVQAASGKMGDLELTGEPGTVQGVRFEFEKEGRWSRLTETRCAVRRDRRWLLCVFQDPVSQRINMRSIPDRSLLLTATSTDSPDAGEGDGLTHVN
jgi:hypothetical protein